ncbi:MAG TPA: flagellar biosynthetic protein FliQ [Kofleriaceae bacterium]
MTASLAGLLREGFLLALYLAAPLLVAALVAGIATGLLGAFTQIQDPAVGLVPRVAAVAVAIALFAPSIGRQLDAFTAKLWPMMTAAGRANAVEATSLAPDAPANGSGASPR